MLFRPVCQQIFFLLFAEMLHILTLHLSEIIVYSGSILIIVYKGTGHQVAFQVALPPLIPSHSDSFRKYTEGKQP